MNTSNVSTATASNSLERCALSASNAIISCFGVLANGLIVIIIARWPQFRQNCKYLQAALAAGDIVTCIGQLLIAIMIILVTYGAFPHGVLVWKCLLLSTPFVLGLIYSNVITIFIALDRLYAICSPIKYWHLKKLRYCTASVIVALSVGCSCALATYTDVDWFSYSAKCVGSASRSVRLDALITYCNLTAGCLVLFIYPVTLAIMRFKMRRAVGDRAATADFVFFKKQIEATRSISYVIAADLLLYGIPNGIILVMGLTGFTTEVMYAARSYVGLTSTIRSSVNCLFYIWKEPKMRALFARVLHCAKESDGHVNSVVPINQNKTSGFIEVGG